MEAFLTWLLQNLSWEALKKALPTSKREELQVFRVALRDAQNRNAELEADHRMVMRLVEQRDTMNAKLIEANRRIATLEGEVVALRNARKA